MQPDQTDNGLKEGMLRSVRLPVGQEPLSPEYCTALRSKILAILAKKDRYVDDRRTFIVTPEGHLLFGAFPKDWANHGTGALDSDIRAAVCSLLEEASPSIPSLPPFNPQFTEQISEQEIEDELERTGKKSKPKKWRWPFASKDTTDQMNRHAAEGVIRGRKQDAIIIEEFNILSRFLENVPAQVIVDMRMALQELVHGKKAVEYFDAQSMSLTSLSVPYGQSAELLLNEQPYIITLTTKKVTLQTAKRDLNNQLYSVQIVIDIHAGLSVGLSDTLTGLRLDIGNYATLRATNGGSIVAKRLAVKNMPHTERKQR